VDKNPKMSTEYQVQGLPTFLLVHRNEVTQRKVGSQPVDALRDMIERAVGVREHDDDGAKQTHAVSEEDEDRIIEDQLKDLGYL
jgi:thioredoxin-like negative regulator of GroEL